jgi:spore maturation protein CgeB
MKSLSQSTLPPRERLMEAMHMVESHELNKFDLSIRSWAIHDPKVMKIVKRVDRKRLEFIKALFSETGFRGEDLEARARLMMVFNSMVHTMHLGVPKKAFRKTPMTHRASTSNPLIHSARSRRSNYIYFFSTLHLI